MDVFPFRRNQEFPLHFLYLLSFISGVVLYYNVLQVPVRKAVCMTT